MIMAANLPYQYAGFELAIFEKALHWKRYWSSLIAPYVSGDVLEVGAGIGANTEALMRFPHQSCTSLEPDAALAAQIRIRGPRHRKIVGTLADVDESFDTILYIDVLEHIEDDRAELMQAAAHLKPGGHVIALSPAHATLYTSFDKAIGHFRRYSKKSLREAAARCGLRPVKMQYLDSAGLLASAANRLVSSPQAPAEWQILTWDRCLIPVSSVLDPLLGYSVGKSILAVWKREF
jgi:SAM-dependent methyltransferase